MSKTGPPQPEPYLGSDLNYEASTPSAPPCYDEAMRLAPGPGPMMPMAAEPVMIQNNSFGQNRPYPTQNSIVLPPPTLTHLPVGSAPIKANCPVCSKFITSNTITKNKYSKYICCGALFLSVIFMCCSCIPLCIWPPLKVSHFCPKCNAFLGTYRAQA